MGHTKGTDSMETKRVAGHTNLPLLVLCGFALTACGGYDDLLPRAGDGGAGGQGAVAIGGAGGSDTSTQPPELYDPPDWWHHYHANSQNSDHIPSPASLESAWSWPDRNATPQQAGPPVASFDGASLSKDQQSIYITTSRDGMPNFYAIDTQTGLERWSFDLDPWATWSAALVDHDDTVFVADNGFAYAIEPPTADETLKVRWKIPHDSVSMAMGYTPWGEVFEVTIEGEVSVYPRQDDGAMEPLARTRLKRHPSLATPIGAGILPDVLESPRLMKLAYGSLPGAPRTGCTTVDDSAGGEFVTPGHVVHLWQEIRAQGLLSKESTLVERFFDTAFGGTFVSNTPSIALLDSGQQGDAVARIFVATLGAYHPPVAIDDPQRAKFTDEILEELYLTHLTFDWQKKKALANLKPTQYALGGRYAIDPDTHHRCDNLGDGVQPYLYPSFGSPSGVDPVLPSSIPQGNDVAEKGARWRAIERMKTDYLRLTRGYYTGYLQMVDYNRSKGTLETLEPIAMSSPSGTSASISPASHREDGQQRLFLAAGPTLFAYDVGTREAAPKQAQWCWNAGLSVGGSPTVFAPGDVDGGADGGPAVAVLAGFRGVTMVQDRPAADCDPETEECCQLDCGDGNPSQQKALSCKVLYDTNPVPFGESPSGSDLTREELYYGGEAVTLAVGTSVPEAGEDHFYAAFTQGPAHDVFYDNFGVGSWEDFMPLTTHYAVVRSRDGKIVQKIKVAEAPVCDSSIGKDGRVYSIHTSGLDQIKHALYPKVFAAPRGGILAYKP